MEETGEILSYFDSFYLVNPNVTRAQLLTSFYGNFPEKNLGNFSQKISEFFLGNLISQPRLTK